MSACWILISYYTLNYRKFVREARRYNADLGQGNIQDKLEVVLTPKGAESKLFPHNLNSLLHYEGETYTSTKGHGDEKYDR